MEANAPDLFNRDPFTSDRVVSVEGKVNKTKEGAMPEKEEKKEEGTERVAEVEAERDSAIERAEKAEGKLATAEAERIVRKAAAEIENLPERAVERVIERATSEELPVAEDGSLDAKKLSERATEAAKTEQEYLAGENGGVKGMGQSQPADETKENDLAKSFERLGLSESAAKVAATGRR